MFVTPTNLIGPHRKLSCLHVRYFSNFFSIITAKLRYHWVVDRHVNEGDRDGSE
jgi:hypothetical protein